MVGTHDLGEYECLFDFVCRSVGAEEVVNAPTHITLSCGGAVAPPCVGVTGVGVEVTEGVGEAGGEKLAESEEDLLEHRTDGTAAFDTLYIGCEKFPQNAISRFSVNGVS